MFGIKPDDLFGKTDQLLYLILQELRKLNESPRPIAKDTAIKQKSKARTIKPKAKPKAIIKSNLEVQNGSNTNN